MTHRSENNTHTIPILLEFWLKFLLRNQTLPEITTILQASLKVVETAKIELPRAFALPSKWPDKFSQACFACWGREGVGPQYGPSWGLVPSPVQSWRPISEEGEVVEPLQSPAWMTDQQHLMRFLGPSVIPLTHVADIVETSMRRIVAIYPPTSDNDGSPPQPPGFYKPDPKAVEKDLRKCCTRVVLEPAPPHWLGQEYPVVSEPQAHSTLLRNALSSHHFDDHDPSQDEIVVLLDPADDASQLLCVGMGLRAKWLRLSPVEDTSDVEVDFRYPPYWYVEQLIAVVPSFWTVDI